MTTRSSNEPIKETVLIVDDQPNNLKVIASVLSDEYNLSIANSGANALKNLENVFPDVILLDIMMPDMDGFQVCRKIKQDPRTNEIPIIFLTAKTDIEDIMTAFDAGGVDYITKPFNQREVKIRVRNHLNLYLAKNRIKKMNQELQNSEKQLKESNEKLAISNREKDKFFSILAHDLKNPFQSILGFTQLLKLRFDTYSNEKKLEYINSIDKSAQLTYTLLEELLEWGKLQQGNLKFQPKETTIGSLFENVIELIKPNADHKDITIQLSIQPELKVKADRYKIISVIRNLIGNAIKYTPRNGTVQVETSISNANVVCKIKDNGMGMNEEKIRDLFKLNKTKSEPGTEGEEGTGLGLLLCKEFVEMHGNLLRVESKTDEGTTFSFMLPLL